jgi:hypothetical protein
MKRIAGLLVALVVVLPAAGQQSDASKFSDEQLEQIAAPVALYPDALLMQVFMAATYPLEVVEADRWVKREKLSGSALDEALKNQEWDPSVKSLCALPDVLSRMSENLDWTRDMGDAFLEQQSQLLDAVQRLRDKAYQAGSLKTTPEQTVTVEPNKIIVIESATPNVVYVPTYSPTVVYGSWPYPVTYYAPLYPPPRPAYGALAFTAGVAVGAALWGDCHWGWGHSEVNINVNRYNNFNQVTSNNFNRVTHNTWEHNAQHRKGVNYRDTRTAQRYGAAEGRERVTRSEARGYGGTRTMERSGARTTGRAGARTTERGAAPRQGAGGGGAFQGARQPSRDRAASSRGAASRGSAGRTGGAQRGARGGGSRGRAGSRGGRR